MKKHLQNCIFFLFLIDCSMGKQVEVVCPDHCECDIFEGRRRASCVDKKLVTIEAFIPNITQILDVSFNQISELGDHIFYDESLLLLELLNISHNKVSQIHIHAFFGLSKLKTLDLSHNAMQYILVDWFWSLEALQELYLEKNNFRNLGDNPLLESKSLSVLDMSSCGILSLGPDAFIKIPSLKYLNLSNNLMIQLNLNLIRSLKQLKELNATGNPFECNEVTRNLTNYCSKNNIAYEGPCRKKSKVSKNMFEQMRMANTSNDVSKNKKNSWIFETSEEPITVTKIIQVCGNGTRSEKSKSFLLEVIELSPAIACLIILVCGIIIGLIIGCTVQIGSDEKLPKEPDYSYHSFRPRRRSNIRNSYNKLRKSGSHFMSTLSLKNKRNDDEDNLNLVDLVDFDVPKSPTLIRKYRT